MILRQITVMMLVANAAAAFLRNAGSGEVWGIEQETAIGGIVSDVNSAAESLGSGPVGLVDAIGGATVAAVSAVADILDVIFAFPLLAHSLGVPGFIVTFVAAPLYVVVAIDVIAILRGDSGI